MRGPRISLCMIARDEEAFLARCLQSVQGAVDEIVLVDTGSRDRTPEIAREHGAVVRRLRWRNDFAAARNRSLDLAKGEWVLYLDADEELHPEDRQRLRELVAVPGVEGYLVRILNFVGRLEDGVVEASLGVRLFRNRREYRFSGTLHEQIGETILRHAPGSIAAGGVRLLHYGYLDEVTARKGKRERNLAMAEAQVSRHPDDGFMRFNLAVEYHRLKRWADAVREYRAAEAVLPPGATWGSKLYKTLTLALIHLGRLGEAIRTAERGLAAYPDYTDLVFLKGVALLTQKRIPKAVAAFRRCLEMGDAPVPPHAAAEQGMGGDRAWFALGHAYEAAGHLEEAIRAHLTAHQLNPQRLQPLYRIAAIVAPRETPEAIRAYFGCFFDLSQPGPLLKLAEILYSVGGAALALPYLDEAERAGADPEEVTIRRGLCFARTHAFERALDAFGAVPPDSPNHRLVGLHRCHCLLHLDREREAHALLEALGGTDADRRFLARLILQDAKEVLERGLATHPAARVLKRELREVCAAQGRLEDGVGDLAEP